MGVEYEWNDGCLRIIVPKELDHHVAEGMKREADQLIDTYNVRKLIFDFRRTEFMDSSGIGVIIGRSKNMRYSGGWVEAANLNDRIRKIFKISGLSKLIQVNG